MPPIDVMAEYGVDVSALAGVTQDSRAVKAGYLFAALKGEAVDGRDYIADAVTRGATVILTHDGVSVEGVQCVTCDNPRAALSHIAAAFYGGQPEDIVAVTGTNGKSSVVHFIDQLCGAAGVSSGFVGTLSGGLTTPDPVRLHAVLQEKAQAGVQCLALEASSHGLAQYRLDGVHLRVAAFTSFSQDHLDYHKDMQSYKDAKLRLFREVLSVDGVAVLNADMGGFDVLRDLCAARGVEVLSYGAAAQDIVVHDIDVRGQAQRVRLAVRGAVGVYDIPLIGGFQVMNVLCALGCVMALYPEKQAAFLAALSTLSPVTGRMQAVSDGVRHVYVDYAHTPDALETVLQAVRPHVAGRLICVFGCGGDRDADKRPKMGAAVSCFADIGIVTDDNPRGEDAASIRRAVIAGADGAARMMDVAGRRDAIVAAVDMMASGDVVLIAGKGHECQQVFDGYADKFNDVDEAKKALGVEESRL